MNAVSYLYCGVPCYTYLSIAISIGSIYVIWLGLCVSEV